MFSKEYIDSLAKFYPELTPVMREFLEPQDNVQHKEFINNKDSYYWIQSPQPRLLKFILDQAELPPHVLSDNHVAYDKRLIEFKPGQVINRNMPDINLTEYKLGIEPQESIIKITYIHTNPIEEINILPSTFTIVKENIEDWEEELGYQFPLEVINDDLCIEGVKLTTREKRAYYKEYKERYDHKITQTDLLFELVSLMEERTQPDEDPTTNSLVIEQDTRIH